MSSNKALFAQRRDGRVAALQYLFAWSINKPTNLADDICTFLQTQEKPRFLHKQPHALSSAAKASLAIFSAFSMKAKPL
jgi:transcription termination factor NusB